MLRVTTCSPSIMSLKLPRPLDQRVGRFCMGAAWREVTDGPQFDAILDMVRGVSLAWKFVALWEC
jgi:biotin synthase